MLVLRLVIKQKKSPNTDEFEKNKSTAQAAFRSPLFGLLPQSIRTKYTFSRFIQ